MRLIELVKAYPNKKWNWWELSKNPCITLQDVLDNPQLPFIDDGVSLNENVTIFDISSSFPLNSELLSRRDFYTEKDYIEHPEIDWCIVHLVKKILSVDYILKHFDLSDNYIVAHMSSNETLNINHIINNLHLEWHWKSVSSNPGIKISDILNHPELPWNYDLVSRYIKIPVEDIVSNPHIPWNYEELSSNKNIKVSEMLKYDLPWDTYSMCLYNPTLEEQDIINYPNLKWHMGFLQANHNISVDFILEYNKTKNNYIGVLKDLTLEKINNSNPTWFSMGSVANLSNITLKDILDNSHLIHFNLKHYSSNRFVKIEDVYNNPDLDWDWCKLSSNTFDL